MEPRSDDPTTGRPPDSRDSRDSRDSPEDPLTAQTRDVPAWPRVLAVVRQDGSTEVTVNGTSHPRHRAEHRRGPTAVLGLVRTQTVLPLGRPVRVDTRDPQGEWQLIVHPDGQVEVADNPAQGRRTRRRNGKRDTSRAPAPGSAAPETDSLPPTPGHDQVNLVDDAVEDPAPRTADTREQDEHLPAAYLEPVPQLLDATTGGDIDEPDRSEDEGPTLQDLLATRPGPRPGPARMGWQAATRRLTLGMIQPAPGPREMARRSAVASVQRSLDGPKTTVVVNPKGGANKTTAALLVAATFGIHRGGYTLAWDNNETRGTLGWRANPAKHANTAVDVLRDLARFADADTARVGNLDNYVRAQGSAQFDVLASDEDDAGAASIDAEAFGRPHATLARFYRVVVIDTGNNMRASNWQAAVAAADQLVIVFTVREDTAQSAAWLVDGLRATSHQRAVRQAVTVLTGPSRTPDDALTQRVHEHFGRLTRAVLDVPHDPALVSGGPINYDALTAQSREAWLRVSAAVAAGL